jgi:hypothetical protein
MVVFLFDRFAGDFEIVFLQIATEVSELWWVPKDDRVESDKPKDPNLKPLSQQRV